MSKVWFTFGLMPGRYHTARIVTNGTAKTLYCAPTYLFYLPEAIWIPIPPLSREGEPFLSGKPVLTVLPDA